MVREYIGARYVPKFMGTYDATQVYEALCVVDNGQGTSYISKIPTPAGTPLSNTTYWMVYGSNSGAILDLQNRMSTAENDIDSLQSDVTNLKRDASGSVIIIGNSYVYNGVADELKTHYDQNHVEYGGGGSGFVPYSLQSNTYGNALATCIAGLTDDEKNNVTAVVFVSAMGDTRALAEVSTYRTDLATAVSNIETAVSSDLPNCKRIIVTLAESRCVPSFTGNDWSNLFRLHRVFKKAFNNTTIEYVGWSGFNALMDTTMFEADNYHPSASGAVKIGHDIVKQIFGGFEYETLTGNDTVACDNYSTGSVINLYSAITPDKSILALRQFVPAAAVPTLQANDDLFTTAAMKYPVPVYNETVGILTIKRLSEVCLEGTAAFNTDSDGCMRCRITNLASIPSTAQTANNKFCLPLEVVSM